MKKKNEKGAADVLRELGFAFDSSKAGKVSIRVPARALLRRKALGGRSLSAATTGFGAMADLLVAARHPSMALAMGASA